MSDQLFSDREELRREEPITYDDAPEGLRLGLREVFDDLGYRFPSVQRSILCSALRRNPSTIDGDEYPDIENEVRKLININPWHKFFDVLQRISKFLSAEKMVEYHDGMNVVFTQERIGYRFKEGIIVRLGTEEFHSAIDQALTALEQEKFAEARRQFERGYEFRNSLPPDWANAIKEAVNSVEAVLQVIYGRSGVSLTTIVSENFPEQVPSGIKQLFRSLYSQGSGTTGARHASIGGNEPTAPRAELALHVAAALHQYAVSELDSK